MVWAANPDTGKPPDSYLMKFEDYPFHHAMMKGYKEKNPKFIYVIEGDEKKIYDEYLFNDTEFRKMPKEAQDASKALKRYVASFTFSNFGGLQTVGDEPLSDNSLDILARFGKVFDLTYTRFNDLKKAEAQAREANIEASLERVRSKAMAMHSSTDLPDTIGVFYHELELFSITPRRCGVGLLNKSTRIAELSTMNATSEGKSIEIIGKIKMEGHPILEEVYTHWLKAEEYHPVLRGSEIHDYYRLLKPQMAFPEYPHDAVQYGYFFFLPRRCCIRLDR